MSTPQQDPQEPKRKEAWVEELEVASSEAVQRVKELIEQGNIRRLIIRQPDGSVIMELPLTASVVAGSAMLVFAPAFAALGAVVAFFAKIRIDVVHEGTPPPDVDEDTVTKTKIDIDDE